MIPFVDETIQLFVEGRSGQVSDVWLDLAGALCGLLGLCWFTDCLRGGIKIDKLRDPSGL